MSLATDITLLETTRTTLVNALAALSVFGPDFSLDGVSMSSMAQVKGLLEALKVIQLQIDAFGGPCWVVTEYR